MLKDSKFGNFAKFKSRKFFALTIMEVVVTIAILGFLILILIVNFNNMTPDDHSAKYKKAIFTVQQIIDDILNDPEVCQLNFYDEVNEEWSNAIPESSLANCYSVDDGTVSNRGIDYEICKRLSTVTTCVAPFLGSRGVLDTSGMRWNLTATGSRQNMNSTFEDGYTIHVDVDNCGDNPSAARNATCVPRNTVASDGVYGITILPNGSVIPATDVEKALLNSNP